ncbi:transposase [Neisseria meningitidis 992008]|nr:transposase [Neisseria meningitidis 992008]MCI3163632.1 transposase [Neisseria meningitidis]MCI3219479.1 transposase [Neisseria meningitidis]
MNIRPECPGTEKCGILADIPTVTEYYSGLNLNQDKATKPQTVQAVRQGKATLYWFKFKPL